ncbi:hypothetical protein A2164_01140 [Candidatus Curtissbacteria bacterium RBG_13_35_7]|uniref:Adenylate kinase n=1 Tax=Candidatus Curtissbacteria bacterium RBG_13_35_7 TaxID=1797705 RepID=A0A1F5G0R8_9BACT|nr:MAG: hypothetical protein A2164_01140 [Candidatus Curtissbacteria bacterium RBG_13_35_7]
MKYIFLGGQGSGKSTQAKLLSEKFNLPHFEMGKICRERAKNQDAIGKQISSHIDKGRLVPPKIIIKLLKETISQKFAQNGYVLDGFPRNAIQFQALDNDIDKVFYIKVSDKDAIKRLTKRARYDDTNEALKTRLEIYHNQTEPLLTIFRNKGILEEIDGERSIEEIHKDVLKRVKCQA